ncbi:RNA polymerase sigma-70 factor (ECF subfamily) [Parabacteroides sp. PF5-5]|nr:MULTISPECIES: sigma-70 family RNA polymerase sigma factor [unclassified Parabacteroides]MDH6303629.1 RNA polymerase sigma-70 factor (ECF subfamily) [Parabacteroides sp. PH5-39]MDH6314951.1 RNA polymerase sigma-70 factor (ECF subfamily) [Parabacteroides sp. PF5-13]MDH6318288.1 RNA polymerase sigma-70 factor (ECF subfamily) [Parabacteroides sp. PH5-13]MDH6321779.1 RNA polymerase sigma-70 factor (ECF subfamily) [Parabacteroides sp. PH5-8]MDH6325903.1 RNA polymerase sigma-70 factor (ECF subfami
MDFEMLAKLRKGDTEAFNYVYTCFKTPITRYLESIVHSLELSQDIYQELLLQIWKNHESIDPNRNFKYYLYLSAKNMAIDVLRKRKSAVEVDLEDDIKDNSHVEDNLHANDTWNIIANTVKNMPPQRRKIFISSRIHNIPNEKIAEQLNIKKNAVEKHLSFALKDIRTVLKSQS